MRALIPILAVLAAPARADGGREVPLADVAGLSEAQAAELLAALVTANVVSSNCAGFGITDGEWALLTGTADRLAPRCWGCRWRTTTDSSTGPPSRP